MRKGNIVILNGVSSAGKTTLSKVMQNTLPEPYFWLAFDTFTDDLAPERFKKIDWSDIWKQCFFLMINTIKLFSDMGKNVIVDGMSIQEDSLDLLHCYPVMHVPKLR